jgi:hypothetical protein
MNKKMRPTHQYFRTNGGFFLSSFGSVISAITQHPHSRNEYSANPESFRDRKLEHRISKLETITECSNKEHAGLGRPRVDGHMRR